MIYFGVSACCVCANFTFLVLNRMSKVEMTWRLTISSSPRTSRVVSLVCRSRASLSKCPCLREWDLKITWPENGKLFSIGHGGIITVDGVVELPINLLQRLHYDPFALGLLCFAVFFLCIFTGITWLSRAWPWIAVSFPSGVSVCPCAAVYTWIVSCCSWAGQDRPEQCPISRFIRIIEMALLIIEE